MSRALKADLAPADAPAPQGHATPWSADGEAALFEAARIAGAAKRGLSTVDILIAMLRAGGSAARLLAERGVGVTTLEVLASKVHLDQGLELVGLERTSRDIASGLGAQQIHSLHLLLAVLRLGGSAIEALRLAGVEPTKLRAVVMRALTGSSAPLERRVPRRRTERRAMSEVDSPKSDSPAPLSAGNRPEAVALVDTPVHAAPDTSGVPGEAQPSTVAPAVALLLPLDPPRAPVLHRERELGRLLDLLQTHTSRVVAVIGEPGSGRRALLSALAAASLNPPVRPAGDLGQPTSAGELLSRLHAHAPADVPIVLDGAAWLGPEGGDGVLALLALARAGRRWIISLTPADSRRLELGSPDLANSIEAVRLVAPEPNVLFDMVASGLDAMALGAGLGFAEDVAKALLRLSPRYPSELAQPGRALAIAEVAVARAQRMSQSEIAARDIAVVVADASGAPASELLRDDDERFRRLEARLGERVIGHQEACARIASVLRRSYAGFRGRRPLASFLLLGPTGVGKTETARAIADALFDGESALVRIDLSEYSEPHAIARLVGSPPGYLGHEEGGQLTEAVRRRPAAVVLLDEMEKAHREVLLVLLQVLEDGRLTDGRGRTVDFSSAAVVMTSNLGSECYRPSCTPGTNTILALARNRLPPELWNRIDEILCYAPLSDADLASIVRRIASDSSRRLCAERDIAFTIDDSVVAEILRVEPDRSLGARPLRRAFERMVEGPLALEIVAGRLPRGARLQVGCNASGALDIRSVF